MFGTQMEPVTFVILVFQVLVLFAQSIIYISRPDDKSRLRFLLLIIFYIFYNACSGLFPDKGITWIPLSIQIVLAYASGIFVAIYFIFYIYKEYDIYPFQLFGVKALAYTLVISFVILFVLPYYLYQDLSLSRKLFLGIPIIVSVSFFIQGTRFLSRVYRERKEKRPNLFRHRLISGNLALFTLSLMPVVVAFGDYQTIEQSIVNCGFIIMMVTYILDFVVQSRNEALILVQLKEKSNTPHLQMAETIVDDILDRLQTFEEKGSFRTPSITIGTLAKKFNTNGRYVSFVVNKHKGKTFNRYVNDLRIDYLDKRLREDGRFRNQYTVKGMASETGFTSADALRRAFVKYKKEKFSVYLKKIRDS